MKAPQEPDRSFGFETSKDFIKTAEVLMKNGKTNRGLRRVLKKAAKLNRKKKKL